MKLNTNKFYFEFSYLKFLYLAMCRIVSFYKEINYLFSIYKIIGAWSRTHKVFIFEPWYSDFIYLREYNGSRISPLCFKRFIIEASRSRWGLQVVLVLPATIESYRTRRSRTRRLNWQVASGGTWWKSRRCLPRASVEAVIGLKKIAHCFGAPNF